MTDTAPGRVWIDTTHYIAADKPQVLDAWRSGAGHETEYVRADLHDAAVDAATAEYLKVIAARDETIANLRQQLRTSSSIADADMRDYLGR